MRHGFPKLVMIAAMVVWPVFAGCGGDDAHVDDNHETPEEHGEHEDHQGHDHEQGESEETPMVGPGLEPGEDEHEGHDHGEQGHEDRGEVHLSPEAVRLAGIQIETARSRSLARTIDLPGEIGFNEDRLVHVTPRYPGVAREVHGRIGAHVKEGDLLAVLESNESLSKYSITAPISGHIIEKHLAVGEFAAEDHDMFLIADLATVWANCEVYAKDMPYVSQGTNVTISAVEGGQSVDATFSYVAPICSEDTRSALARAVLANDGILWRPGTFIRATVPVAMGGPRLTVARDAVQILGEQEVVFVPADEDGAFEIAPVRTGIKSETLIEILSGLEEGVAYVAAGAFELKAQMVTASLDAHAGHGH